MKRNCFILVLIAFTSCIFGQIPKDNMPKEGIIKGMILDATDNSPVNYATISIMRAKDSVLVTGSISQSDGHFTIPDIPFGMFYAEISFIGFEKTATKAIKVFPKSSIVDLGEIKISPASTNLKQVEIVAETPMIEYKIDRKVINVSQNLSASGGTAIDALENAPSVQTDIEGNLTLRGSSNFKVLVDGKPTVLDGSEALEQIPAGAIENIEIITNPSVKYDPDEMAGIINVIMKKRKSPGVNGIFNASIGTRNKYSTDILLNYRTNRINYFLKLKYDDRNFLMNIDDFISYKGSSYLSRNAAREMNSNRTGKGINGGIDFYLNDRNTFTVSGDYGTRNSQRESNSDYFDTFTDSILYFKSYGIGSQDMNYYKINVDHQIKFKKEGHELLSSFSYTGEAGSHSDGLTEYLQDSIYPINETRSVEDNPESDLLAKMDYTRPLKNEGKLESGYQLRMEQEKYNIDYENFDFDQKLWIVIDSLSNKYILERNIHSFYGIFSNRFKGIGYQAGLRLEYTDQLFSSEEVNYPVNRTDFFPSVHFSKQFNHHQLMLSYSKRVQRPRIGHMNPSVRYIDSKTRRVGNPYLEPEYSHAIELNYQYTFSDKSFFSIEGYYRQQNNMIERVREVYNGITTLTERNINNSFSVGTEIMGNISLYKWWMINPSINFFNFELSDESLSDTISKSTNTWNARLMTNFMLKWGMKIQVFGFYNAPSITSQGDRESFFSLNFAVKQDFFKKRLNVIAQLMDPFQTSKFSATAYGTNFYSISEFKRESPILTLSVSYKINNFKNKKGQNGKEEENNGNSNDMPFDESF